MKLAIDPKIVGLANALSLYGPDPVQEIRDFCRQKVSDLARRIKRPFTISELQESICKSLKLKVHYIWSEQELVSLSNHYVGRGEILFAAIGQQLGPDEFGVFIHLRRPCDDGCCCLALIDCRGDKHYKRYWTLWHEIAHCLTSVGQYQLPLRRSSVGSAPKDPIEVITDMVASDFAFYPPIFTPIFEEQFHKTGKVNFETVEAVRKRFCEEASFLATLNACASASPIPTLVVEAGMAYNKSQRQQIESGKGKPAPALRILRSTQNTAARVSHLWIPDNYRVPETSAIFRVGSSGQFVRSKFLGSSENLGDWKDSRERFLPARAVLVDARKAGESVIALISAD